MSNYEGKRSEKGLPYKYINYCPELLIGRFLTLQNSLLSKATGIFNCKIFNENGQVTVPGWIAGYDSIKVATSR
jgi:hypothetical protein